MPTLCPEISRTPPGLADEEPRVCVKQEEDQAFDYPAAFTVKSEENLQTLQTLETLETACFLPPVPEEAGGPIEEEPGCSMNLHPSDGNTEQNYDTDDSEDWRPTEKQPPKSAGVKRKRGRPARSTILTAEQSNESVTNGGKRKNKVCPICGKAFSSDAYLKKHMLAHCGQRPFKCQVCDKGFRNRGNFRKHTVIHADEKPFICPACQRGFSQKCHLQAHMRIHTGEKPFSCPDCGVRFRYQRNIYRHITAVHKGEKPFSCPFCDKAFSQKSPFIVHMRTHTGEKPFSCSICKKGFIDNCHLKKHIKTHEVQNR